MTSYLKALFHRNPAAAQELRKHQLATFRNGERARDWMSLQAQAAQNTFGKRRPTGLQACAANCGHPACKQGCTLIGRFD